MLDLDTHLTVDELRAILGEHPDIPVGIIAAYLKRWWHLDDDQAFKVVVERNPTMIRLFPLVASPAKDWSEDLPATAVQEFQSRTAVPAADTTAWASWLHAWLEKQLVRDSPSWTFPLAEFAATLLSDEVIQQTMSALRPSDAARLITTLTHQRLSERIAHLAPEVMNLGLREAWRVHQKQNGDRRWTTLADLHLGTLGRAALQDDHLLLGYSLGVRATEAGKGVKLGHFWKAPEFWSLAVTNAVHLPNEVLLQANLWALLRRLADLNGHSMRTENLGVSSEILAFAETHVDSWVLALPLIADRYDLLRGTGESVTVLLAARSTSVVNAIEALCVGPEPSLRRERALGVRAMLKGIGSPNHELVTLVVDTLARWVDGTQIFPHPLSLPSSIWVGSRDVESALRTFVSYAESDFRERFSSLAGLDEDIHTAQLLFSLEKVMNAGDFTVTGLSARRSHGPIASISYRQSSKQTEEPKYGLDLALVIEANVESKIRYVAAQFVQVKKLRRASSQSVFSDSWSIHSEQLRTILGKSSTACYWFFDERGTILAVSARLLLAIGNARRRIGESFTVSRSEIRSMAVSLPQFFVDLFIGGWTGDASPDVLRIARGEDPLIQPRVMANMKIDWLQGEDRQG